MKLRGGSNEAREKIPEDCSEAHELPGAGIGREWRCIRCGKEPGPSVRAIGRGWIKDLRPKRRDATVTSIEEGRKRA